MARRRRASHAAVGRPAGRPAGRATPTSSRVLELWAGRTVSDVAKELGRLLADEHVPYLAALRYKPSGLRKRAEWEQTWDLQRREDARRGRRRHPGAAEVHAPPTSSRRRTGSTAASSTCPRSGSSPTPAPSAAPTPPWCSAGPAGTTPSRRRRWPRWSVNRQQQEGWDAERLTPLLAGLAELEPWLHQWHAEPDPRMGMSPAQAVTATLEQQLARLGLTRADLAAWRPAAATRGRRARTTEES